MGADGRGPTGLKSRQQRTLFVRVPTDDWPLVRRGMKTEFRGEIGKMATVFNVHTPTPCVAYARTRGESPDARLMILEKCWQEELGLISEESLQREGFNDVAEFRRYWVTRHRGKRFLPTRKVFVYRMGLWREDSRATMADLLLRRVYGDWLP
jgi:hypothetical protein